jgi:hypothetical protein
MRKEYDFSNAVRGKYVKPYFTAETEKYVKKLVEELKNFTLPEDMLLKKLEKLTKMEFKRGVLFAAIIARDYNSCSTHKYDLGDCIEAKLNQIGKRPIRKNPKAVKV